jgi:hypothetical protein
LRDDSQNLLTIFSSIVRKIVVAIVTALRKPGLTPMCIEGVKAIEVGEGIVG